MFIIGEMGWKRKERGMCSWKEKGMGGGQRKKKKPTKDHKKRKEKKKKRKDHFQNAFFPD